MTSFPKKSLPIWDHSKEGLTRPWVWNHLDKEGFRLTEVTLSHKHLELYQPILETFQEKGWLDFHSSEATGTTTEIHNFFLRKEAEDQLPSVLKANHWDVPYSVGLSGLEKGLGIKLSI